MYHNLNVISSDHLSLSGIFKEHDRLEKQFGDAIWSVIWPYFPRNFNKDVLELERILFVMRSHEELGTEQTVSITITKEEYPEGSIRDLSDVVQRLNRMEVEGFKIKVYWYAPEETDPERQKITIKITKLYETIQGTSEVITGIEDHTTRVLCHS